MPYSLLRDAIARNDLTVYHLSHTDLDGYASQYIAKHAFPSTVFRNANYGEEVMEAFSELVAAANKKGGEAFFLITDLNLTKEEATEIERHLSEDLEAKHSGLLLLDHHVSGKEVADKTFWYRLDTTKCATSLTYETFKYLLPDYCTTELGRFSDVVESVDLWKTHHPDFSKAGLLSDLVMSVDLIPDNYPDLQREYRFHIMRMFSGALLKGLTTREIEERVYLFRSSYLDGLIPECLYRDEDATIAQMYFQYIAQIMQSERLPEFRIGKLRGRMVFNFPGHVFQHASHIYLKSNPEVDYLVNIKKNGRMSFRSIGQKDVASLAHRYFGGGGHRNAAGAALPVRRLMESRSEAIRLYHKFAHAGKRIDSR